MADAKAAEADMERHPLYPELGQKGNGHDKQKVVFAMRRVDGDGRSVSSHSSDDDSNQIDDADPEHAADWAEERSTRETWTGQLDFILSCVGYAVGLGNVWRFPYLCYNNGGGAFLVPYFIFLALCGMPLTMLEMCMGQFVSLGPTALFQKFCPLFQGLGWAQVFISGICCIYYNIIICWTLYYLYQSVRMLLPWETCNVWDASACLGAPTALPWSTCNQWWNNATTCVSGIAELVDNSTDNGTIGRQTASEQFWQRYVLRITDGIDELGGVRFELAVCLLLAWLLIFACLFKGVKSSGRVVYVTATFPYVVLVILMFRGLTLPGALNGVYFYLVPQWHRLLELKVWLAAASQIFYSVGAAWGVMFTFASFNRFHHNCYRDAIVIPLINCGTSIFAGIVVFSIIGFMAEESGMDIGKVITSGPGLAFIVYPEVVANLPISPLWAVLFFLMLLTIGVDSQFGMFETLITAFVDTWPLTLRKRKALFTGGVCALMFVLGLPCVMEGGMYVLQLMDWYCATFSLMLVSTLECVLLSWNYGLQRFATDVYLMVRRRPARWFLLCWAFITPALVMLLLVMSLVFHVPVSYDKYEYPGWAIGLGWSIASASVLPLPYFAVRNILGAKGSLVQRVAELMRPTADWGPSRLGDRVAFRKSFSQAAGRQRYVMGVERQETEMYSLAVTRPSCADLNKFVEEVHNIDI